MPFRLALTGQLAGLEVRATVHSAMTSRTGFERTVEGERLGSTVATTSAPATALPRGTQRRSGAHAAPAGPEPRRATRTGSGCRCPGGSRTGVFPVEIELRDPESGERVASFVTHLVAVAPAIDGAPLGEPLNVAWIWNDRGRPGDQRRRQGPRRLPRRDRARPAGSPGWRPRRRAPSTSPSRSRPDRRPLESWNQQAKTNAPAAAGHLGPALRGAHAAGAHRSVRADRHPEPRSRGGLGDEASLELGAGFGHTRPGAQHARRRAVRPTSHHSTPPRSTGSS